MAASADEPDAIALPGLLAGMRVIDRVLRLPLLDDVDVSVENYQAGMIDGFGFGYDRIHHNSRLVYAAVPCFGHARTGQSRRGNR